MITLTAKEVLLITRNDNFTELLKRPLPSKQSIVLYEFATGLRDILQQITEDSQKIKDKYEVNGTLSADKEAEYLKEVESLTEKEYSFDPGTITHEMIDDVPMTPVVANLYFTKIVEK